MTLTQLEEAKIQFLKRAYQAANEHNPTSVYSVSINPWSIGNSLGLESKTTERLVIDLVKDHLIQSVKGMQYIWLERSALHYLQKAEHQEMQQDVRLVRRVDKEDYSGARQDLLKHKYRHSLKIQVVRELANGDFEGEILFTHYDENLFQAASPNNTSTIVFMMNLRKDKHAGLFTWDDGMSFYEITSHRLLDPNGPYIFHFRRYDPAKKNPMGNVTIQNSPNSIVQLQNNSSHSQQQASADSTGYSHADFAAEVTAQLATLRAHLTEKESVKLTKVVEVYQGEIEEGDVEEYTSTGKKLIKLLKRLPENILGKMLTTQALDFIQQFPTPF